MYVFEICAEWIFVTFPWWLENVKSRSKIALFSNELHFEIWFPKKQTITFFWGKLSKLYKKDPILHVATIFSLKQGETRTSHGPIPHPLTFSTTYILSKNIICTIFNIAASTDPVVQTTTEFVTPTVQQSSMRGMVKLSNWYASGKLNLVLSAKTVFHNSHLYVVLGGAIRMSIH